MNKDEYHLKMESLLASISVKMIPRDPTGTFQARSNKWITKFKKIDNIQVKRINKYNSVAPRIYGNPKIHKINTPLIPIVSNGPTTNLTLYISQMLMKAYDRNNSYFIKDSYSFSKRINNFVLPPNYVVISLIVVNLFGNITKNIILEALI